MDHNPARRIFLKQCIYGISALTFAGCGGGGSGSSTTTQLPTDSDPDPVPVALPSILVEPMDQTVMPGETAIFQLIADGTPPLSYQWRRNGIDITGANDTSYTVSPAAAGDDALFSVIISNAAGVVESRSAALTVITTTTTTADSTTITVDTMSLTVDET